MKLEKPQDLPDEDANQIPMELVRALTRLRECDVKIPPSMDIAILRAGKSRMLGIRQKNDSRVKIWRLWPLAAAACFLLAWLAFRPAPPSGKNRHPAIATSEDPASIILREFSSLYPNQVKFIVRTNHGIELALSDKPYIKSGKPLAFKVCESRGCEEIITFSGQSIDVVGHQVTVSSDSTGRVSLDGEQFLWSSEFEESSIPGIHIASRQL